MVDNHERWERHAGLYDEHNQGTGDPLRALLYDRAFFELLGDIQSHIILDAGCGNGYIAEQLAATAHEVVGFDFSSGLVKHAQERSHHVNARYSVGNLTQPFDLPDDSFDDAVCNLALHYVSSLEEPADEFRRVLKPGGKLIIGVEHPAVMLFLHAQALLGTKPPKLEATASYFEAKPLRRNTINGQAEFIMYNRTLSDYLNPFLQRGFVLTGIHEPRITEEELAIHPEYERIKDSPRFLLLKFTLAA